MPTDELFFNIRLEGESSFKLEPGTVMPDSTGDGVEAKLPTVVLIEAGLSSWKENPYRANIITEFRESDVDDQHEERTFPTSEELFTWLEARIEELTKRGFQTVRYKANGMPIDWLNRINLPE